MSLILEGPDNIGKTTAARAFAEFMEWEAYHMSVPPDGFDYLTGYIEQFQPQAVHDRFHLGGLVYGLLMGLHPQTYTHQKFQIVSRYLRWSGAITVVMYESDDDAYHARLLNDREQMFTQPDMVTVNQLYRSLGYRLPQVDICHDVSKHGFPNEATFKKWKDYIRQRGS